MSPIVKGMLLMTISMAFLVVGDSAVKMLSDSDSPFILIFSMGFAAVLIFADVARLYPATVRPHGRHLVLQRAPDNEHDRRNLYRYCQRAVHLVARGMGAQVLVRT